MPWIVSTEMEQKERFIEMVLQKGSSFSEICCHVGISRKTGYKWLSRFKKEGREGLYPKLRQPQSCPHKTAAELEAHVLYVRDKHPKWGGAKIHAYLSQRGVYGLPSAKTIQNILKRHGRITEAESLKHKPYIRFEHPHPNDLWQMDFKGHFETRDGFRCHPLTLLDDHSRFSLLIRSCVDERSGTVKKALIEVFRKYGMPRRMTMDNGTPWGCSGNQLYTTLSAWFIRLGIKVHYSRPYHPQTQGKLERFHRTLKEELLSRYYFDDFHHAQKGFDYWRQEYNEVRPHAALDNKTPQCRYKASERPYPEVLPPVEYPSDMEVRKVQKDGIIFFRGKQYRVGFAFYGNPVGLSPHEKNKDLMDVYYCQQKVLTLDLRVPSK